MQAEHERRPGAVDELVGDDRDDDLAAQAVAAHLAGVALGQRWREVPLEVVREVRILGKVRLEQQRVQVDLAVRHHHRELGRDKSQVVAAALGERLVVREELDLAVQTGELLKVANQPRVDVDHRRRLRQRQAHRLRLRVAAVQHPLRDCVGHLDEQLIALLLGHVAVGDERVEQDLDVDLVV